MSTTKWGTKQQDNQGAAPTAWVRKSWDSFLRRTHSGQTGCCLPGDCPLWSLLAP